MVDCNRNIIITIIIIIEIIIMIIIIIIIIIIITLHFSSKHCSIFAGHLILRDGAILHN